MNEHFNPRSYKEGFEEACKRFSGNILRTKMLERINDIPTIVSNPKYTRPITAQEVRERCIKIVEDVFDEIN